MKNEEVLKKIFNYNQPFQRDGVEVYSMIIYVLRSARYLSGVDLETAKFDISNTFKTLENDLYFSFQFSGILNYLILLEQIGSLVEPKDKIKSTNEKGIKRCLFYFSELDDEERTILYQLRNSLAHRFSLATEKNNNPHKFAISIEDNDKVIEKSLVQWDGNYSNKNENASTTIYLRNLIILVESIFENIQEMAKKEKLNLVLEEGFEELFSRYTIK